MLVDPTVANLLEKVENRYRLVVASAKREQDKFMQEAHQWLKQMTLHQ